MKRLHHPTALRAANAARSQERTLIMPYVPETAVPVGRR
jgi:hypothetical protein